MRARPEHGSTRHTARPASTSTQSCRSPTHAQALCCKLSHKLCRPAALHCPTLPAAACGVRAASSGMPPRTSCCHASQASLPSYRSTAVAPSTRCVRAHTPCATHALPCRPMPTHADAPDQAPTALASSLSSPHVEAPAVQAAVPLPLNHVPDCFPSLPLPPSLFLCTSHFSGRPYGCPRALLAPLQAHALGPGLTLDVHAVHAPNIHSTTQPPSVTRIHTCSAARAQSPTQQQAIVPRESKSNTQPHYWPPQLSDHTLLCAFVGRASLHRPFPLSATPSWIFTTQF